jgi:phosphomannomutase
MTAAEGALTFAAGSLGACLDHTPVHLAFGTSGRRGLLKDLTQLEVFICALAELDYLQSLPVAEGGITRGDVIYFASDLRPSSVGLTAGSPVRGELAQVIEVAIRSAGMVPVYLGHIPTPALTAYAVSRGRGSMMVTGSHIPFDRNGYKTNTAVGELLKHHEPPIAERVVSVRQRLYAEAADDSLFASNGQLKAGHTALPVADASAEEAYLSRYLDFFGAAALAGLRLLVYQHSAVGRDLVPRILRSLGAEVFEAGRSEQFVPIDTENIDAAQLQVMQALVDEAIARYGRVDALVSTDGDSDRPLVLGVDPATGQARFFGGDLVGMVTAEYLAADAAVVPISCNDAIDRGELRGILEPKTRIGSPYVIAGMVAAIAQGKRAVCGWEANGGFLTGTPITRQGRTLTALPTRDAMLPIIAVLAQSRACGQSLVEVFAHLPRRFSKAALLKDFPRALSHAMLAHFTPAEWAGPEWVFGARASGQTLVEHHAIATRLEGFFSEKDGFGPISKINYVDGVRIYFDNGDVAHIRPSGNADELRIYAVSDTQQRADQMVTLATAEPDGILRLMAKSVTMPLH